MKKTQLPRLHTSFKKLGLRLFLLLILSGITTTAFAQIYVDTDASGANDGSTWANAYTSLQDALAAATGSNQIWIAEGAYYPDEGTNQSQGDRTASFSIIGSQDGLKIHGGFAGTESTLGQRDLSAHKTILSGDIEGSHDGDLAGNSYHVVVVNGNKPPMASFSGETNNLRVNLTDQSSDPDGSISSYSWDFDDGNTSSATNPSHSYASDGTYTITLTVTDNDGASDTASGDFEVSSGGGFGISIGREAPTGTGGVMTTQTTMNASITGATVLSDVTITMGNAQGSGFGADGGGLYCEGRGRLCSPILQNIVFANNHADVEGGAIFNNGYAGGDSSPIIINAVFTGNEADKNAGAIFNAGAGSGSKSSPTIINSTFYGNTAGSRDGGAILNNGINGGESDPQITNSIFFGNSAGRYGAQIFNRSGGSPTFSHSLIEGSGGSGGWDTNLGTDDGGNLDANPDFVNISNPKGADTIFGTSDDGLALQASSPVINAGENTAITLTQDVTGANRVQNSSVDLGAYESTFTAASSSSLVIHVDASATGNNDGTSWADAFTSLQNALASATASNQIWIAEGTYRPTTGTDRDISFTVNAPQDGLKIYGGFAGTETSLSQRDTAAHVVMLSGDIGISGDASDNSYHVVLFDGRTSGNNITTATRLAGVTISDGNANDPAASFTNRSGGGLYCSGSSSGNECSPTLGNIIFTNNQAAQLGGALSNDGGFSGLSSPQITGCTFKSNSATSGGAIHNGGNNGGTSNPTIEGNTFFKANQATSFGGAIFNNGAGGNSSPNINNTLFLNNQAPNGGSVFNDGTNNGVSSPVISNTAFIQNTATTGNGGAINNTSGSGSNPGGVSSPTLTNVVFQTNSAGTDGGAVFNDGRNGGNSSPIVTGALFISNKTMNGNGGAFYSTGATGGQSTPIITNSTFFGNTSGADGGAIVNDLFDSGGSNTSGTVNTTVTNTILFGNDATNGGDQIYNRGSQVAPTLSYTLVENGPGGVVNASGSTTHYSDESGSNVSFSSSTNIQGDPLFVNASDPNGPDNDLATADDGLALMPKSPAIDIGNSTISGLPSNDITTNERIKGINVDLGAYEAPAQARITGSEGWRMMTAPAGGMSYNTLLDPLWLQGITGADVTTGDPNLYIWGEAIQQFVAVGDASNIPNAGQGFIVYVYEDDNYETPGLQGGFPKALPASGARSSGSVSPALSYHNDGEATTINDGFNLVGNPYGLSIDWDAASGWTKTNLSSSIYVWDNASGSYLSYNGMTGTGNFIDGLIAPFQGFWVQANAAGPVLKFTEAVQTTGGVFYGKARSRNTEQPVPQIKFSLEECRSGCHPDNSNPETSTTEGAGRQPALQSQAVVMFSPKAKTGRDRLDAVKLASLNAHYLSLYTSDTEGDALDINALPQPDTTAAMQVDMNLKGSALGGSYTLSWGPHALPDGWLATLTDTYTDKTMDLGRDGEYSFTVEKTREVSKTSRVSDAAGGGGSAGKLSALRGGVLPTVVKGKVANLRFTLTIAPKKAPGPQLPQTLAISAAYPNPFGKRCNVDLAMPKAALVHVVVYDILGRKVATVADTKMDAGTHTLQMNAAKMGIASGVYLCRLKVGTKTKTMKMTFIK